MNSLNDSLPAFASALNRGESVYCDDRGKWYVEGRLMRLVRWIFRTQDWAMISCARAFSKHLDDLEKGKGFFYRNNEEDAATAIKKRLHAPKEKNQLERRIIALCYRCGIASQPITLDSIVEMAGDWKKKDPRFLVKELTERDIEKLNKTAKYPEFVSLLANDPELRNDFFKWIIRDHNKVKPYILYPAVTKRLKESFLSGRLSYYACKPLKIVSGAPTLLCNGIRVSLLNEDKEVVLENRLTARVGEILNSFRDKNFRTGNLELLQSGVSNWNTHEIGTYNPTVNRIDHIEVGKERWWEDLPVLKEVETAKLLERTGLVHIEERQWVVVVKASREYPNLDIDKSHGYLEIAIPCGNGRWRLYDFGKYAKDYPDSIWKMCKFITGTVEARIQSPDENVFYSHRQHAAIAIPCDEERGVRVMNRIAEWIKRSRESNVVFQFVGENCACWPEEIVKEFFPERQLYYTDIMNSQPSVQPLKGIFKIITFFPKKYNSFFLRVIEIVFASYRGKEVIENGKRVWKSVWTSDFHRTDKINLPAYLFKNDEVKVTYGN